MLIIIITLKTLKRGNIDDDITSDVVNETEILISVDRYNFDTFEGLKKDYPDKIEKLKEASNKYISENDLKI